MDDERDMTTVVVTLKNPVTGYSKDFTLVIPPWDIFYSVDAEYPLPEIPWTALSEDGELQPNPRDPDYIYARAENLEVVQLGRMAHALKLGGMSLQGETADELVADLKRRYDAIVIRALLNKWNAITMRMESVVTNDVVPFHVAGAADSPGSS